MPIHFACPSCGKRVIAREGYEGRRARCPGCSHIVTVPASPAITSQSVAAGPTTSEGHFAGTVLLTMMVRKQVDLDPTAAWLGRRVAAYDMPSIRAIIRDAAPADHRWSAIVAGVVRSTPFQMKRADQR